MGLYICGMAFLDGQYMPNEIIKIEKGKDSNLKIRIGRNNSELHY